MDSGYHGAGEATPPVGERSHMLGAALAYTRRGTPVFQLRRGTKEPFYGSRGFYEATLDEEQVRERWGRCPDANIGIPTGRSSGLLVLDVDPGKWGTGSLDELVEEHGELPDTATVRTGGGGLHYYFRYPRDPGGEIRNSAGKLGSGLDVRGEGGYVVAPPSVTAGPYETLDRFPLADPPEWLLALLRAQPRRPGLSPKRGDRATTPILAAGEKIPDGVRNSTLASIAGRLHDGTRALEALTVDLMRVNEDRCVPPLAEAEVAKIAKSIHRKEPAKPTAKVEPEVLEALDGIEIAHLRGRTWKGQGWKTPYSALVVLVLEARRHGRKVEDGVEVSMGVRPLALRAGTSKNAIVRAGGALDKLEDADLVRRSKTNSGPKAGAFVLLSPRGVARVDHSPTKGAASSSGNTYPHPPTAPRLRYSKPVFDQGERVDTIRRLGKPAERVVDILEYARGWMSVSEIASELGLKVNRDLRRGALARLTNAAVVEWKGDDVRLRLDWRGALDRKREADEEVADHHRDRKRYAEQSRNYRDRLEARKLWRVGLEVEEIAEHLNLGTEDVRRHLNIEHDPDAPTVDGFIGELEYLGAPIPENAETRMNSESLGGGPEGYGRTQKPDEAPAVVMGCVEESRHGDEGADAEILAALEEALVRWPDHRGDYPSWWASTLYVDDYLDYRPDPGEVALALEVLSLKVAA